MEVIVISSLVDWVVTEAEEVTRAVVEDWLMIELELITDEDETEGDTVGETVGDEMILEVGRVEMFDETETVALGVLLGEGVAEGVTIVGTVREGVGEGRITVGVGL